MRKRFIVLIEVSTKDQNDALLEWIKSSGFGWWHWFQNAWLLVGHGDLDAVRIRDKLREIYGTANNLVVEFTDGSDTWAGFGPSAGEKDMFKWLRETWTTK